MKDLHHVNDSQCCINFFCYLLVLICAICSFKFFLTQGKLEFDKVALRHFLKTKDHTKMLLSLKYVCL